MFSNHVPTSLHLHSPCLEFVVDRLATWHLRTAFSTLLGYTEYTYHTFTRVVNFTGLNNGQYTRELGTVWIKLAMHTETQDRLGVCVNYLLFRTHCRALPRLQVVRPWL